MFCSPVERQEFHLASTKVFDPWKLFKFLKETAYGLTFCSRHNCAKWSSIWFFPFTVSRAHIDSNKLEDAFATLEYSKNAQQNWSQLTTSFKFEVLPTTSFMMENRFISEFSPNGSWVNWYLKKSLVILCYDRKSYRRHTEISFKSGGFPSIGQ